jgi:hypothetical protein
VAREASAAAKKKAPVSAPSVPKTEIPEDVFSAVPEAPIKKAAAAPTKKYPNYLRARGAFNRGEITKEQLNSMKFSSAEVPKEFDFQNDEAGIPLTGRVARDRFVKKIRDEDLDRRDANILRAGGAGALAGLMFRGGLSRGKRALIGAGLGGAGVIAARMATDRTRDIYGERSRGAKRAELIPAVGGLGAAAWLGMRRFKGLSAKLRGVKEFGSSSYSRLVRKLSNHLSQRRDHVLTSKLPNALGHPSVSIHSPKPSYDDWWSRENYLFNKLSYKSNHGRIREYRNSRRSIQGQEALAAEAAKNAMSGRASFRSKDFSARRRAIKFFEKKEKGGLNPYVGAALSGFGSGAALGSLALLRRGASFRSAAKTAGKLGLASAGIVGGGALLGSKIVGDPRSEESAPFMKRAAIGGSLVGAGAGLAGALLLRKTKGGARALVAASKKTEPFSRPAMWLRKTPIVGAAGIGALGGGIYGGAMGADEGQQVDSIRNLRKDLKKEFQVSPLPNVEPMEATRARRSSERSDFLKRVGILGAIGLTGVAGFRLGRGFVNAEKIAAQKKARFWQDAAEGAKKASQDRPRSSGPKTEGWSNPFGSSSYRSGGGYDSDYAKRSAEAAKKWRQEQPRSSASSSSYRAESGTGSKDYTPPPRSRAQGTGEDRNPHVGTAKEDVWEKWRAMDRMAKESKNQGERDTAARMRDMWKKKHNLSRKLRGLKLFGRADQPRDPTTKQYKDPLWSWATGKRLIKINPDGTQGDWAPDSPQLVNSAMAHAARARVPLQRTGRLTKDVGDVLQGKERERDASGRIKKREWEKSWFNNMVTTAGIGAATLGGAILWRKGVRNPNSGLGKVVGGIKQGVKKTGEDFRRVTGDFMRGTQTYTENSRGKNTNGLKIRELARKLREFDDAAESAGWDLRDPRGRSARVFAPGSRRRDRREKKWHEKTENERKLWMAGAAGAAVLGGAGALGVYRLAKGKSLVPNFLMKSKSPTAANPADMKSKVEAMTKMANEQAAQRQAQAAAAWKKKQKGKTPTKEANDEWKKTQPTPISSDPNFKAA